MFSLVWNSSWVPTLWTSLIALLRKSEWHIHVDPTSCLRDKQLLGTVYFTSADSEGKYFRRKVKMLLISIRVNIVIVVFVPLSFWSLETTWEPCKTKIECKLCSAVNSCTHRNCLFCCKYKKVKYFFVFRKAKNRAQPSKCRLLTFYPP